jgi:hypothetical protein
LPKAAFSALASDANFACPALQLDRWTSTRVPTFAYEFNDDDAPSASHRRHTDRGTNGQPAGDRADSRQRPGRLFLPATPVSATS